MAIFVFCGAKMLSHDIQNEEVKREPGKVVNLTPILNVSGQKGNTQEFTVRSI